MKDGTFTQVKYSPCFNFFLCIVHSGDGFTTVLGRQDALIHIFSLGTHILYSRGDGTGLKVVN